MTSVSDILMEAHEDRIGKVETDLAELTTQVLPPLARVEERLNHLGSMVSRIDSKLDGISSLDQRLTSVEGSWKGVKTVGKWLGAVVGTVAAGIVVHFLSR